MTSIPPRPIPAESSTRSIMPNAAVQRPPASTASATVSPRTTATLRCAEENSSARIVINNFPFLVADNFDFHLFDFSRFHFPTSVFEPFSPLDYGDTVRRQKLFDARRRHCLRRFEAIKIQVKQSQASAGIFIHQCERR